MNTDQITALRKAGLTDEAIARVLDLASIAPIHIEPAPVGSNEIVAAGLADGSLTLEPAADAPRWPVGTTVRFSTATADDFRVGEIIAHELLRGGDMLYRIEARIGGHAYRYLRRAEDIADVPAPRGLDADPIAFPIGTEVLHSVFAGAPITTRGTVIDTRIVDDGERVYRIRRGNSCTVWCEAMHIVAAPVDVPTREVPESEAPSVPVVQALDLPRRARFVSTGFRSSREENDRRRAAGLLLIGNTYPAKEAIKAAGGVWSARSQGWLMPDQETFDALEAYCATLTESMPLPRRRARSSRTNTPRRAHPQAGRCEDAPCCGCCPR